MKLLGGERANLDSLLSNCLPFSLIYSNKGTFYVLCAPGVVHADPEVAEKYGM